MADFTILAMTGEADWLEHVQPDLRALGGTRIIVAESMAEACVLLDSSGALLVILNWNSEGVCCELLDHLLWMNSTLAHPAKVLIVSEDYRADLAVTLFRMGVDEYLSRDEHSDRFPSVLCQLLNRVQETGAGLERALTSLDPIPPAEGRKSRAARRLAVAANP